MISSCSNPPRYQRLLPASRWVYLLGNVSADSSKQVLIAFISAGLEASMRINWIGRPDSHQAAIRSSNLTRLCFEHRYRRARFFRCCRLYKMINFGHRERSFNIEVLLRWDRTSPLLRSERTRCFFQGASSLAFP